MRTHRITLDQAVPGLRLAKPVTGPTGIVVLGTGSELTEALIERLKKLGIPAVFVEPDAALADLHTKPVEQLEQELRRRFRHTGGDPTLQLIQGAILNQIRASRWEDTPQ